MIFSTFRKILVCASVLCVLAVPCRAQGEASNTIAPAEKADTSTDMRPVAATVAKMLEQGHYLHPLSLSEKNPPRLESENPQTMSERVLKNYLQMLDYMHLYFTQDDVNEFMNRFAPTLSSQIPSGDLNAPREIFTRFRQRVEERVSKNKALAEAPHDFKSSKTVEIDRKKAPWPASSEEADRLWSDRIEAELLQESLNEHPLNPPAKVVTKRYNQFLKNINEQTDEEVIKTFLVALAQSYDPHSEYMSPSDMENFNIQMRLSLVGIGAVLRTDDGYAKIVEVVPGGPADKDGRLKPNDRIAAVAQGKGPFEDVVDMKLDKVVEKIRGAKGSQVRIQVIPANSTDPSKRNVIEITREEVKLKESEAKGEVIDYKEPNGKIEKFGWLTVPSFYAEMDRHGQADAKSTTKDVRKIVDRMKKEGIEGLVIDLRRDGGGSLEEAINLTGLFVGAGPVVQAKDATGRVSVARDDEKEPFYTGPVIVLVNRLSASASEIFAAALQDYGRAVIVGDERSFGKGTVQTLLDVGKFMPLFLDQGAKAGSLKLTIQKFYRVSGGSTQHRGVLSDIVLPSTTDTPEIGESSLPNPLAYDEVDPQPVRHFTFTSPLIEELKNRSSERVSQDAEFAYINEDMKRFREKLSLNQLSLNEKQRRDEMAKDKQMKKSRLAERKKTPRAEPVAYEVTLDTVEKEKLPRVTVKGKLKAEKAAKAADGADGDDEKEDEGPVPDPIKAEALNILNDLANQMQGTRTAKIMDRE
ncbi:MAG: tail-specific protease [Proteobacteria bacterium]|nr:tail-specific protease [Pseudomonadota bacterium]